MSQRLINRKGNNLLPQVLVAESSSSDSDSDTSSSSSSSSEDEQPTSRQPMFVTKQKQAKKAISKKVAESGVVVGPGGPSSTSKMNNANEENSNNNAKPASSSPKTNNNNNNNNNKKQPQGKKSGNNNNNNAPPAKKSNNNTNNNKKKNNNNKNSSSPTTKKESEEEKLLRELEKQRRREQGLPSDDESDNNSDDSDFDDENVSSRQYPSQQQQFTNAPVNITSLATARQVVESLLSIENKFSSRLYDPRTERISRFGKESVERVTDDSNSAKKRFRPSPFVTPNVSSWPPFDAYGAQLRKNNNNNSNSGKNKSSASISEYTVDVSSDESAKAEASLQNAIDSSDLDALFAHWRKYSYHLPTLMQVYRTASMINQEEVSRQAIDMALYTSGILLAAFPETGSYFTNRRLNGRSSHGSAMVLQVIHLGVHQALKKGCGRTAFELCKLLLSMDCEDDVECGWAIIDYVAIRSSQFIWLQNLARAMEVLGTAASSPSFVPQQQQQDKAAYYLYHSLVERYRVLPQLTFGPALAYCFQHDSDKEPDQCYFDAVLPAVRRMPSVAVEIAVAVGLPDNCPGMEEILAMGDKNINDAQDRITQLYVKRNTELWRTKNLPGLLRRAIAEVGTNPDELSAINEKSCNIATKVISLVQRHYGFDDNEDHIMGSNPQAVPNELLNGAGGGGGMGDQEEEDGVDEHGNIVRRGGGAGGGGRGFAQGRFVIPPETPEYLRETLLRFEALFGPLQPHHFQNQQQENHNNGQYTLNDLFARYDEMLQDRVVRRRQQQQQQEGDGENNDENNNEQQEGASANNNFLTGAAATFVDFFRTMMPDLSAITSTRNDLLLQELRESGIPDPVRVMHDRFDREHPDEMMFEPPRHNDDDDDEN